jgi:hypothetical protein
MSAPRKAYDTEMLDWLERKAPITIECEIVGNEVLGAGVNRLIERYTIDGGKSKHPSLRDAIQHRMAAEQPQFFSPLEVRRV